MAFEAQRKLQEQKKKPRVGIITAWLMITAALVCDILQVALASFAAISTLGAIFIPFSWALSFSAFVSFWLWFMLLGVNYLDRNASARVLTMVLAFAVEWVPVLNLIPAITLGVAAVIFTSRHADQRSGLFAKAHKRYAAMDAEKRALREAAARRAFMNDQQSLTAKRARKQGGAQPEGPYDFKKVEQELKERRTSGKDERQEAPLYDPKEEAARREREKRAARQQNWF